MNGEWQILRQRGLTFEELEAEQERCIQSVRETADKRYILASEPRPTFTGGLSSQSTDLIWGESERRSREVDIHLVSRGGKWTYHGPGQVVFYVIARLNRLGLGNRAAHQFLQILRMATLQYLADIGADAQPGDSPFGIFHGDKKLVSYGVGIRRGIVCHGLALYCKDQTAYFGGIHPCGVPGGQTISLEQLGLELDWDDIVSGLSERVKKSFKTDKN